jgi:hypothetical protein
MKPHRFLNSFSRHGCRPFWSYRYTGTLPRLISLVSHSCANTGGVGVFFLFWNEGPPPASSTHCHSNSHGTISFADPHHLNSVVSYRYKNMGKGAFPGLQHSNVQPSNRSYRAFWERRSRSGRDVPTYLDAKSLRHNLFADPHPLNLYATIFYKKGGRRGVAQFKPLLTSLPHTSLRPLSPLSATLMGLPASVANKRLTAQLNPLDATLTKNRGYPLQANSLSSPRRKSSSTGVAIISRTRSRSAGTSSFVDPLVSMVSCR